MSWGRREPLPSGTGQTPNRGRNRYTLAPPDPGVPGQGELRGRGDAYMYEGVRRRLRLRWAFPVMSIAGLALAVSLSSCSVGGEVCSVKGAASFTPGLAVAKRAVSYTFPGNLTPRQSALGDSTIHKATVSAPATAARVGSPGGATAGT